MYQQSCFDYESKLFKQLCNINLFEEFLIKDKNTSEPVQTYLVHVIEKDDVLLSYLWGRKHRADYAWQTVSLSLY